MTVHPGDLLWRVDAAIHAATADAARTRLGPDNPATGPLDALLRRRSVRDFADVELDPLDLRRVAQRVVATTRAMLPTVHLDVLAIGRRGGWFAEAELVGIEGVTPLPDWAPVPVGGVDRPLPEQQICRAGGFLVTCGRRGTLPEAWDGYRRLLVKAGYVAAACSVEATAAGLASCLASGILRSAFWEALGGRSADLFPVVLVAMGVELPAGVDPPAAGP